ncbi:MULTISPECIES: hypothetical protein [unclassified Sinorhizobium]|uniref:hypothetical protein n=1 Tax=unclassified Sinorhizobium TaxID=2613772 RepID=UPI0024C28F02|nr:MULTISPECIES: hypothetical protein [unclassified Sinorhizobium]MDK1378403.1 hypothetical protein [Sinorhizobium sp. 6-70]MDK1482438.1 hypothetical protein [Sinorhizobium sp. 6-117]
MSDAALDRQSREAGEGSRKPRRPWWVLPLLFTVLAIFAGANVHFIYVAVRSDPGCAAHLKERSGVEGVYRAAGSAC